MIVNFQPAAFGFLLCFGGVIGKIEAPGPATFDEGLHERALGLHRVHQIVRCPLVAQEPKNDGNRSHQQWQQVSLIMCGQQPSCSPTGCQLNSWNNCQCSSPCLPCRKKPIKSNEGQYRKIIVVTDHSRVLLWDSRTSAWTERAYGAWELVDSAVFAPDGNVTIVGIRPGRGTTLWHLEQPDPLVHFDLRYATGMVFCPDGTSFAVKDYGVRVGIGSSGVEYLRDWPLEEMSGYVKEMAFSPDGHLLALAIGLPEGKTPFVPLLDGHTGDLIAQFDVEALCVGFSLDNRQLVVADRSRVHYFDTVTKAEIRTVDIEPSLIATFSGIVPHLT